MMVMITMMAVVVVVMRDDDGDDNDGGGDDEAKGPGAGGDACACMRACVYIFLFQNKTLYCGFMNQSETKYILKCLYNL